MTRPGGYWQNWSRSARVRPLRVERPRDAAGVQRAVVAAGRQNLTIKAVGAGHSFSPIALAPGVLLDLAELQGLVSVDQTAATATFLAGTRLHRIPALLAPYGLAMQNLGDIDGQSLAGAISTGTHGTGVDFGGLASQVVALTMVTADGGLRQITAQDDEQLLSAAAVGLGALGIVTEVTLQLVPAFVLDALEVPAPLDDVLATLADRAGASDHYEFFWFPHTEVALTRRLERMAEASVRQPLGKVGRWVDERLVSNGVYRAACAASQVVPAIAPPFNRTAVRITGDRAYRDMSHRVYTQRRTVRFHEMEYAVPAEQVVPAFRAVQDEIIRRGFRIEFPLEVRFAAADSLWLSTAYQRPSAYIAVHRYWRANPTEYFQAIEKIMLDFDGRPHWGKMHTLDADRLSKLYPRWSDFQELREQLDPNRRFSNPYLERVLGS